MFLEVIFIYCYNNAVLNGFQEYIDYSVFD